MFTEQIVTDEGEQWVYTIAVDEGKQRLDHRYIIRPTNDIKEIIIAGDGAPKDIDRRKVFQHNIYLNNRNIGNMIIVKGGPEDGASMFLHFDERSDAALLLSHSWQFGVTLANGSEISRLDDSCHYHALEFTLFAMHVKSTSDSCYSIKEFRTANKYDKETIDRLKDRPEYASEVQTYFSDLCESLTYLAFPYLVIRHNMLIHFGILNRIHPEDLAEKMFEIILEELTEDEIAEASIEDMRAVMRTSDELGASATLH